MSSPCVRLGDIPGIPQEAFSLFTRWRSFVPGKYTTFDMLGGKTLRLRGPGVSDVEFPLVATLSEEAAADAAGKAVLAIIQYKREANNRNQPGGVH